MSVLTRIKNNQITDSTILANTKIVPGSIVGSLFNSNLTMTSDVTITGNLTVQGSSTYLTVASTNTYVNDPLIVMNNAFVGTNTNDIGLLFNRGSDTNQAIIWDESEDEFRLIATSESGDTYGAVTTSSYANVRVGNLNVEYTANIGSLNLASDFSAVNANLSGDLAIDGGDVTTTASTFNLLTANATTVNAFTSATTLELGAASGTTNVNNNLDVDGNISLDGENLTVTATTFNLANDTATTVNAFGAATSLTIGATTGNTTIRNNLDVDLSLNARDLQATVIGNVTPAAATFTTLTTQDTTQLGLTNATAINNTPIGNATPSTGAFTTLTSSNNANLGPLTAESINNTVIGNVSPAAATFTTLTTQGTTQLSLTTATAINNTPIGNATASTGAFTTLTANGVTTVTDTTPASAVGEGAFRVSGGASVAGNLYVGGNINIVGSSYILTGNAGVFYGDANGFGALYAGVPGYTILPSTVFQTAADINNYAQNNFENINTGAKASTDWVATAGDGSDYDHYIDMGITTANWDGTQDNSLTNAVGANDGYLYVQGNIITGAGGNLTIGASTPGTKKVSVIVGGNTAANITAVFNTPGTPSTDTTTGALTVIGGVGVFGNINANNLTTGGSISTADLTLTGDLAVDGGDITTTASTFNLLAANATSVNAFGAATTLVLGSTSGNTYVQNVLVGNATTQSNNTTTGAIVTLGGVGIAKNLNVGGDVVITGNLQVDGDVTTVNTATLDVEDLNITVAKGAINSAAANGAGLTVDGASATFTYANADDSWNVNKLFKGTSASFSANLGVTGDTTLTDNLAVNGGDITTTATTFNLLDATATTVNAFGAATAIDLGATTGTLTINNPAVVGSQTTQDLFNTTATTLNFAGAATTLNIGATSGTASLLNSNIWMPNATTVDGAQANISLYNNATTVDAFKAATDLEFGATTGTLTINNPAVVGSQTTQDLFNTTATTLNFAGAATSIVAGATTGTFSIRNANLALPNATTIYSSQAAISLLDENILTANAFGAATSLTLAATSGTTVIRNNLDVDLSLNARDLQATVIGNVTPAAATFTNLTTTGTANLGPLTAESINGTVIGNVSPAAATFTTLTTQSTTQLSLTSATAINNTPIGNATPSTGAFTTLTTNSTANLGPLTAESINGTVIGNVSPASGDFTRLSATGIVYANSTVASTNYTNGALLVAGGVGVGGNLHVSANSQIVVGADLDSNLAVSIENVRAAFVGNTANGPTVIVRNISANSSARSEVQIGNDSWDDVDVNHLHIGLAGTGYDTIVDPLVKANDGYLFNTIGNLVLGSEEANIVFVAGGRETSISEVARIVSSTRSLTVVSNTESTSSSTGALIVAGGVGLGANLNVYGGAVFNNAQSDEVFQVKGQFANTLIYADTVTDTVTIGGSNTTPASGATLRVNGTGALIIPVGTSGQRPGSSGNVDVAGMLRLNSTLGILEFHDGSTWQSTQGSFTLISNDSFTGNGVANVFTMSGSSTTNAALVSINGIVQIPGTSYSIADTTLTFTEAPDVGDIIDIRRLTTTVSVDEIGFGFNTFNANALSASISTGSSVATLAMVVDTNQVVTFTNDVIIQGNLTVNGDTNGQINIGDSNTDNVAITAEINSDLVPSTNNAYDLGSSTQRWRKVYSYATVHDQTATNVAANATPVLIDQFLTSAYSSAKYLVQIKDGSNIQAAELLLVQDSANAYVTTYGVLSSNVELGTFTANVSSGNVNLYYTSTTATNSNVKVHSTYIV